MLCERGIRTFETSTRNTLDLSAVPVLRERTHLPILVDPSHGVGVRRWIRPLRGRRRPSAPTGSSSRFIPTPNKQSLMLTRHSPLRTSHRSSQICRVSRCSPDGNSSRDRDGAGGRVRRCSRPRSAHHGASRGAAADSCRCRTAACSRMQMRRPRAVSRHATVIDSQPPVGALGSLTSRMRRPGDPAACPISTVRSWHATRAQMVASDFFALKVARYAPFDVVRGPDAPRIGSTRPGGGALRLQPPYCRLSRRVSLGGSSRAQQPAALFLVRRRCREGRGRGRATVWARSHAPSGAAFRLPTLPCALRNTPSPPQQPVVAYAQSLGPAPAGVRLASSILGPHTRWAPCATLYRAQAHWRARPRSSP